jgi:predicted P-loop ATPase
MFFEKVTDKMARENTFHPVRDYLNALVWDGTPRIDQSLATYGGAVDEDRGAERNCFGTS